jgi:hypothetical protein
MVVDDKKKKSKTLNIPSSIFKDRSLSVLEILVEYLKEKKQLTYHEIAQLLNRNDRTIWTVYHRAKQKRKHAQNK